MTAGFLAALSIVDAELAGRSRYIALNAVATRFDPIYEKAHGWFINLVPVAADLSRAETFEQRVVALQGAVGRSRAAAATPARAVVDTVMSAMGRGTVSSTAVPPIVSYLDMRRFRGAELPGADEIVGIAGPGSTADVSLWINRKSERTYVAVSHPDTPTARASVSAYVASLRDVLARTARAAELAARL
jgi:hypothetical protein